MSEPEFILKTTPPRLPRTAVERERFSKIWDIVRERTAIAVIAPAGFGKTTLLAQWRRRWLAQGALVAWLTVDRQDDPSRFNRALLHSVRVASGRNPAEEGGPPGALFDPFSIEALTGLLGDIASLGKQTVLIIDDIERLPEASSLHSLVYLLYNAPPNLHVMMGSRQPLPFQTGELAAKGNMAVFKAADLRLQPEESVAILEKRFGSRLSLDECMRLHEATEGWPIGLQLAVAAIEPESDLSAAIASLSGRHSGIERYFIESLFSRQSDRVAAFLTRIAILDRMSAPMCEAVAAEPEAAAFLDQLLLDTPILIVAEHEDWYRLHPLVRDFLLSRFEQLGVPEQRELHGRACRWFADREQFPEAASHALAAGDEALAQAYAAKSLWILRSQGKVAEAQAWLERIPDAVIAADVNLRLIAAWAMALGERNAEAFRIARDVLHDPAVDDQTQFVAALVASSATGYSDKLGLVPDLFLRWPEFPADITEPVRALTYRNAMANLRLHAGQTDAVRRILALPEGAADRGTARLALAFRTMLLGLSHLWDGNVFQAEAVLRPAIAQAERAAGRRSEVACLHAAVLAACLWERDQALASSALLADRLDVIERTGFPDTILLAYLTLARVAAAQGDERRALQLLNGLGDLAERRRLPRLALHGLVEQIRLHAQHRRHETVARLLQALDALEARFDLEEFRPYLPQYRLAAAIARTCAAIARQDFELAEAEVGRADELARALNRQRDVLTVKVMRAVLARRHDRQLAQSLLAEAESLASIGGIARLLADACPDAVAMADDLQARPANAMPVVNTVVREAELTSSARPSPMRCGPLTPKEAEVLVLLDEGMSNKLIARALEISDETVKWHLKNLFTKLSAGNRKHAVDRARLLGLVGH